MLKNANFTLIDVQ